MIKVGIIGANGYTGFELMRLLASHNQAKLEFASSRSMAGEKISSIYPSLDFFYKDKKFDSIDVNDAIKRCDVIFTALPHATSAEIAGKFADKNVKVIDLSADFRYDDVKLFESTYKVEHPRRDLNEKAVYGLCEIFRDKIKGAQIVGNPGCYVTSALLPLIPLIKEKVISPNGIIIDAKSGASGAGRKSDADYILCESDGNFKAYGVTTHRHTTEIEEKLSAYDEKVTVSFTPHLLPIKRGILSTIYANVTASESDIKKVYDSYYKNEKFVRVCDGLPEIKWVAGSNVCAIGYKFDVKCGRIIIVSCIDNLIKGASGQAIQNMNVMFGLPEDTGLPVLGQYI